MSSLRSATIPTRRRGVNARSTTERRYHGAAAVEAALVLPVLGLIAFGCVDLGRVIHAQIALTNAVRVGAEYGATHRFTPDGRPEWESRIHDVLIEEAANIDGLSTNDLAIEIDVADDGAGDLQIAVSAAGSVDMIVRWPGLPESLVLRHSVTMRQYR